MHIPHKTHNKQQTASNWASVTGVSRAVLLMSILIISIGIFASYHQPISASGIAPTEFEINHHIDGEKGPVTESIARSTDKLATTPSIWPTSGAVTSGFGWRNSPWGDGSELHPGIDIANGIGTPVVATADGEVVQTGWSGGYGNIVQIDHGNSIETIYGHNSQIAVSVGQSVKKGQIISYVGSTGRSTGPHVHYEIRVNGIAVDPIKYMVLY